MKNYPYNPALLHALNALRDDFIANAELAVKNHSDINMNTVDIFSTRDIICESRLATECISASIEHNDFLLARILIGNHLL